MGCHARINCNAASNTKAEKITHPTRLVPKTRVNLNAYGGIKQANRLRAVPYNDTMLKLIPWFKQVPDHATHVQKMKISIEKPGRLTEELSLFGLYPS